MNILTRRTALVAVALSAALAGCGNNGQSAAPTSETPDTSETSATSAPSSGADPQTGLTHIWDMFGPGCNQIPATGAGSAQTMLTEPAGVAASHNPQLSTLMQAVQAAGLTQALNDPTKSYTLFAPTNSAFQQLPPGTLDQLLKDKEKLAKILNHHIVPQRYSAVQLANADSVATSEGGDLKFDGDAQSMSIGDQQAHVQCGNIPTKNATVFVIDKVLTPPAS